jgi:outer membrane protein TolC
MFFNASAPSARNAPRRGVAVFAAFFSCAASTGGIAQALSLGEAQRIAAGGAPLLAAQEAAVRAAREASIGASELPDPKLTLGVENLPIEGGDRFSLTRDFMTMRKVGVMQDFVRGEKLRLRGERADAEVRKEIAALAVTQANLHRDVALAWIDVWAAEHQLALLRELESEAGLAVTTAQAALAGGKGQAAEPFAARLSEAQMVDRMVEARRAIARARVQLSRWIGDEAVRTLGDAPDFARLMHRHADLLEDLDAHPHLAMYAPMQAMADAEVRLAEAAKRPDWSVELAYAQRGPAYSNMVSIGVRIDLPLFEARRQNPAIASRLAAAEQVRAQADDARRAHLAEIRMLLADWDAAVERARRFEAAQIPIARERSQAALADYRGGKSDIAPVLEARRAEIETRIANLQATTEMARAWAQLTFLLPAAPTEVHP